MPYRLSFAVAFFTLLFWGCKKTDFAVPGSMRLKSIESGKDSVFYTKFTYDSQNLLTEMADSTSQGYVRKTVITYNSQNKPIKFTSFQTAGNPLTLTDSLVYSSNGQVIEKIKGHYYTGPFKVNNMYAYDAKGRLIADTLYAYVFINNDYVYMLTNYSKYSYDINDNITQVQEFSNTGSVLIETSRIDITYDRYPNPFKSIGPFVYFVENSNNYMSIGHFYLLSANNMLTLKVHYLNNSARDNATTYKYDYKNGKMEKVTIQGETFNSSYTSFVKLFYE
jgi:hypothetical protein